MPKRFRVPRKFVSAKKVISFCPWGSAMDQITYPSVRFRGFPATSLRRFRGSDRARNYTGNDEGGSEVRPGRRGMSGALVERPGKWKIDASSSLLRDRKSTRLNSSH